MTNLPSGDDLQETLDSFLKSQGEDRQGKMSELMELLKKSRERKAQGDEPDQECPEDVDDCNEITSPCCNAKVSTIFGTLPLLVRCFGCGEQYRMGELVRNLLKK